LIITRYINGVAVSEEQLRGYTASSEIFSQAVNRVRARVGRTSVRRRRKQKRDNAIM
jgi:hypothetical protein